MWLEGGSGLVGESSADVDLSVFPLFNECGGIESAMLYRGMSGFSGRGC